MRHIGVVGAGNVGTAIAYTTLVKGMADKISLYDLDAARVRAELLDLRHGLEFVGPASIQGGDDPAVCEDADVIVITAGAKQRPGESRRDLAARNGELFRKLVPELTHVAPTALILVVTNPVDVLTQLAVEITSRDDGTVFGSGTVLDSSRLRHLLALRFGIAERHIHAHVVGEHGDSEVVLWSSATIGGAPLLGVETVEGQVLGQSDCQQILDQVRGAAYEIIAGKGATSWAISLATAQILEAVAYSDHASVLPVTAPVGSDLGMGDVCLSLPRRVTAMGAGEVMPLNATETELAAIRDSADAVMASLHSIA